MSGETQGRRRPRGLVWGLACLGLVGVAVAVAVVGSGGVDSTASAKPSCAGRSQRISACPHNATFTPRQFTIHGDAYDCRDFATQADAQAVLRANPRDPNHLDAQADGVSADHYGVACAMLPAPKDATPVAALAATARAACRRADTRSARCPQPRRRFDPRGYLRDAVDEYDCQAFASQADAQAVLRFRPDDPNRLDGDGDGIACPELAAPKDRKPVVTRTS